MCEWTETTQKCGTCRRNFTHSVHIVHANHRKIDGHEGRDVGVFNITVAFSSADMDEDIKMALHGRLVELMVNISPQIYRHHVIYERVRPVLNGTLKKDFYNCLRLALGLYKQIELYMRGKGFELNPYNPCVTKKLLGASKYQSAGMWKT